MASIARTLHIARPAALRLAPRAAAPAVVTRTPFRTFSTSRMSLLRKYTKDHEWVDLSADHKTAVVGISEYAAEQLGDVVYVELPEASGEWMEQGDTLGAVESVKSASDINAPIRCKITSVNVNLEEKPSIINQVPEDDSAGGGWIAKVEVDEEGAKQLDALMDSEAYKAFTSSE
ncbi:Glycine cleavage system H protein-like protein [Hapsidospora chrysogenum ATCC 11550]|uniref:Glycine cleavage system H protein n=1 Tax=Hapsidospora chrysogenum (strain ATCC 11550 / CBS 779.69 / DSM 880 / IAM 14645 / JCM 23072 / IMI 49137) TaxID=857340 RepID=A0A086T2R1_HAPC1|nr:Glycine cleavage system H protein-like protein [Hapsidospora chrysogenum ATCC 11550]